MRAARDGSWPSRGALLARGGWRAAAKAVEALQQRQDFFRPVRLAPQTRGVLVRFGQRRINMDGAEELVEADALAHGQHEFGDQLAGLGADDRGAEHAVAARRGEHFDESLGLALGDGAVALRKLV